MSKVNIKFIFSNSNVAVDAKVSKSASGMDLKLLLFLQWPKETPNCKDPERIRLICLGRVIGDDDELLSGGSAKHLNANSPLPVHVSIKPVEEAKNPSASEADKSSQNPTCKDSKHSANCKGQREAIDRNALGSTPALQEVCQCVIA